jgi:hypothetical protein
LANCRAKYFALAALPGRALVFLVRDDDGDGHRFLRPGKRDVERNETVLPASADEAPETSPSGSGPSSLTGLEIGGFAGHIQRMTQRRLLTLSWVLLLVLTVSGCTSCGWIWQDWLDSPQKACRDRVPEQK